MENKTDTDKIIFECILFFYQLETMLKTHNSMLSDKILEGELVASSIVFNNALIISNIKRILKDNPKLQEYSNSKEFKERLESLLSTLKSQEKIKSYLN